MGGVIANIEAETKTELKRLVEQWAKGMIDAGLEDIRLGWNPKKVVKTKNGYKIQVWAHS